MNTTIDGPVAVVTGGARGIGRGISEVLAEAGMTVVVADRDRAAAEDTASRVGGVAVPVDVADDGSVAELADRVRREVGRATLLVNNAGVVATGPLVEATRSDWQRLLDVNAWGVLACSRALAPDLAVGGGSIVNVSSIAARRGSAGFGLYAASKFAALALSQVLAIELAPAVRVNSVCPGFVATGMADELEASGFGTAEDNARRLQLLDGPQAPEDIGRAVLFLATAPAVTGQALNVDGGTVLS